MRLSSVSFADGRRVRAAREQRERREQCSLSAPLLFTNLACMLRSMPADDRWGHSQVMPDEDWVTVGEYSGPLSAAIVSRRLTEEGVPNRIWSPPQSGGECFLWVARESLDAAKAILSQPAVSEEDLTALALRDPPPDDFRTDESESRARAPGAQDPVARSSASPIAWLIAVAVVALALALFAYLPRSPATREVARQHSPNGRVDAVLMEVSQEAEGTRSYKVCLQAANPSQSQPGYCGQELAYLAGVRVSTSPPVGLIWTAPADLEIRYTNAARVQLYRPVVASGYGARSAIVVRLVQKTADQE